MNKALWSLFVGAALFAGCAAPYTPAPQILPSNMRKIYVRPFVNNTTQYGLEEKLTLRVIDEFIRDGRMAVVNKEEDANGMVVGEITKYILQPLTYDANNVTQQYKLWILVNIHLVDRDNNVTLWTEQNMEGIQIFVPKTTDPAFGRDEEEVREDIWDTLSRSIVKRTVDGFGSVSGASDKKVPK